MMPVFKMATTSKRDRKTEKERHIREIFEENRYDGDLSPECGNHRRNACNG